MSRRMAPCLGAALLALASSGAAAPRAGSADGFALSRSLQPGTLVEPGFEAEGGRLSPDARQVVYVAPGRLRRKALFLKPAAGGSPRPLVDEDFDVGGPCFSPDGAWVYFHSAEVGPEKIYRVRLEDGFRERLTSGAGHDLHPSLSGDGRLLAYDSDREGGGYDIWVRDLEARSELRLTLHPGADFYPTFHPDGTRVAFTSSRDGGWKIWSKALAGGQAVLLSRGAGADNHASASPDGRLVAFDSDRGGGLGVFLVSWAGGDVTPVALPAAHAGTPSFGRDGLLVYLSDLHGVTSLESRPLGPGLGGVAAAAPPRAAPRRPDLAFTVPPDPAPAIPPRPPGFAGAAPAEAEGEPPPSGLEAIRVLAYHPAAGNQPVPAEAPLYLTLSHRVRAPEGWQGVARLEARGGRQVPVAVTYNPALRRIDITPEDPLETGAYRVSVLPGTLVGEAGQGFDGHRWSFRSQGAPAALAPAAPEPTEGPLRILAVSPRVGQIGVRPDAQVAVRFSRPYDPASVTPESLVVRGAGGVAHSGDIHLGKGDRVLHLRPHSPFQGGVEYQVEVARGLRDPAGASLEGKNRWSFRVAHGSALKVVAVEPADRQLAAETTLTLTFNRPVDPRALQAGEVILEGGGLPHKGSMLLDSTKKILLFQPYARLPPRTEFVLHLPPGLADLEGNGLELEEPLRFRTGKEEATSSDAALFARHLGGAGAVSPAARLAAAGESPPGAGGEAGGVPALAPAGGAGAPPEWVPQVLRVLRRKGYLDPALAGSLESPAGLTRYKTALLVDSARDRQVAMTPYERKLLARLLDEVRPELARLGRADVDPQAETPLLAAR